MRSVNKTSNIHESNMGECYKQIFLDISVSCPQNISKDTETSTKYHFKTIRSKF